eukprot:snap_masked-scaffold_73-processed-gene-0.31-mRNA-1 protein AED:1.00 eAED:1.00 QI:0/0/0/0/1/1/2/0/59
MKKKHLLGFKVLILFKFLDKTYGWEGFPYVKDIVDDNIIFEAGFVTKTNKYYMRYFYKC